VVDGGKGWMDGDRIGAVHGGYKVGMERQEGRSKVADKVRECNECILGFLICFR